MTARVMLIPPFHKSGLGCANDTKEGFIQTKIFQLKFFMKGV